MCRSKAPWLFQWRSVTPFLGATVSQFLSRDRGSSPSRFPGKSASRLEVAEEALGAVEDTEVGVAVEVAVEVTEVEVAVDQEEEEEDLRITERMIFVRARVVT